MVAQFTYFGLLFEADRYGLFLNDQWMDENSRFGEFKLSQTVMSLLFYI